MPGKLKMEEIASLTGYSVSTVSSGLERQVLYQR